MNEPETKQPKPDPREWEWAEDRDEPPPREWQDVAARDYGVPRWGPI